jgi:hypothetical protein
MALLDLLKPKVCTLEDWSPDVPRSRIDMDALLADMRQSGVATLDSVLGEYLDGNYQPHQPDYGQSARIVSELSETDRLRLLGRAAQTSAVVMYLHLTWPETIQTAKAQIWTGMLDHAVSSIERTKVPLDDRAAAGLTRAARIRLTEPGSLIPCSLPGSSSAVRRSR